MTKDFGIEIEEKNLKLRGEQEKTPEKKQPIFCLPYTFSFLLMFSVLKTKENNASPIANLLTLLSTSSWLFNNVFRYFFIIIIFKEGK